SNVVLRRALADKGLLAPGQLVFDPISKAQFIANGFTNVSNVGFLDVAAALGVDLAADLASGNRDVVQRACTLGSGLTANARCAERHVTPGAPGPGLWWTMDFLSPDASGNAFASPIGPSNGNLVTPPGEEAAFALEGGEALWSWPNGLLGFASFNRDLDLVSSPPILTPLTTGPEAGAFAGIGSCFSCHAAATIPMIDSLLPAALESNGEYSAAELGFVLQHVPRQEELDALFELDAQAYRSALRDAYYKVGPEGDLPDGVHALGASYHFDLTIEQVVAELAVDESQLLDVLDGGDFGTIREQLLGQGAVSREAFTLFSHELYQSLGSPPESLLGACVTRDLADGEETGD
ncbi:MAG TPA: hypothetical protein VFS00_27195, partial [Polyangiaceae bacterium]|nr:hypothetical protein [Polyangiaceae bacterium]